MYRKLLVPLDGSSLAERALIHAQSIAERYGAVIVLVHAVVPLPYVVPNPVMTTGEAAPLIADAWAAARDEAHGYLRRARGLLPSDLTVETEVLDGPPATTLLEYAERAGIDMVVMTTHGHSGLGHLVFGNIAEQMLHEAKIPLLLIRVR